MASLPSVQGKSSLLELNGYQRTLIPVFGFGLEDNHSGENTECKCVLQEEGLPF